MKRLLPRLALLVLTTAALVRAADRPNVLFIAVDDLRPEFGAYGAGYVKSPNLDRIAREGITFNRSYCQQAVCSPTRSSLLTGTRPDTTKVWDLVTHFRAALPNVATLPQHFKNHGYFVQGMGKIYHGGFDDPASWSVPWQTPKAPTYGRAENLAFNRGQDGVDPDGDPKATKGKGKGKKAAAPVTEKKVKTPTPKNSRGPAFEGSDVPDNYFQDGKVAELALTTLREVSQKKEPFFLAVGFIKPHLPFISPQKYWDLYNPADIKLAPNKFRPKDAPDYAIQPGGELRNYRDIPEGSIPDDVARQLKHGYYAAISYMDAQVGKVLDELDRLDLRKNTIVILWGDHGWKLGEHDAWCKHSNCENDTNTALLLSVPGMKQRGVKTNSIVEFVDVYPTLADLAGLPLPSHLEGLSFRPLVDDPQRPWKQAAFSQYPRPGGKSGSGPLMGYAMRTDRYRFVVWVSRENHSKIDAIELYDHQVDPQENQNLAKRPEHKALVEKLMGQWRAGWQGNGPLAAK
jgi:arylsulfatase A-like enzyme